MFYEGEKVRTCQEVTKKMRDILKAAGIKPGQRGVVVSEVTYVEVNFGDKVLTLTDDSIECVERDNIKDDVNLDALKDLFGFK